MQRDARRAWLMQYESSGHHTGAVEWRHTAILWAYGHVYIHAENQQQKTLNAMLHALRDHRQFLPRDAVPVHIRSSACRTVRHTPVCYRNDFTRHHAVSTIYTVSRKMCHYIFACIFAECCPIFKILSPIISLGICQ